MNYPDEMFDEAERRERLNKLVEQAITNNAPALKTLAETERNELIDKAIEELGWIMLGGQDGREFADSVLFIKQVLESLK